MRWLAEKKFPENGDGSFLANAKASRPCASAAGDRIRCRRFLLRGPAWERNRGALRLRPARQERRVRRRWVPGSEMFPVRKIAWQFCIFRPDKFAGGKSLRRKRPQVTIVKSDRHFRCFRTNKCARNALRPVARRHV